jgi:hypothetical protein
VVYLDECLATVIHPEPYRPRSAYLYHSPLHLLLAASYKGRRL